MFFIDCLFFHAVALENNVLISGTLVTEPCTIDPSHSDIPLNFGSVIKKYFDLYPRTESELFQIILIECDTSLGQHATVTFTGNESLSLSGLLQPDNGDVHGIAIGIEQADGTALPLNQPTPLYQLSDGTTTLTLKSYIAKEPEQTVIAGPFTATATFAVSYP
ncbi:type 1 fimbrial protein [Hafnia alvei]|uniref:Type 1 fimbrial protein n=2 Tax=Hafnia alvei TaxID=569 RepID=A0ABD7Q6I4_HAFAL|nr:type 1 fimbrial protein [Hafnia alvei]